MPFALLILCLKGGTYLPELLHILSQLQCHDFCVIPITKVQPTTICKQVTLNRNKVKQVKKFWVAKFLNYISMQKSTAKIELWFDDTSEKVQFRWRRVRIKAWPPCLQKSVIPGKDEDASKLSRAPRNVQSFQLATSSQIYPPIPFHLPDLKWDS